MNFNRNLVQTYIENVVGCTDAEKWNSYREKLIAYCLSIKDSETLCNYAQNDSMSFYFKAAVSFLEAIHGLKSNRFSWSIIKLYYSVYYLLRAEILLNNYLIVRNGPIYFCRNKQGEKFEKFKDSKGDHQTAINFIKMLNDKLIINDPLQSGEIEDLLPYKWLLSQREHINYHRKDFPDPDFTDLIYAPSEMIKSGKENEMVQLYLKNKSYLFAFSKEHAIVAIPIYKFSKIRELFRKLNISLNVNEILKDHFGILQENMVGSPFKFIYE